MRQVKDEGLEWLEKERKLRQGLVKSSGLEGAGTQARPSNINDASASVNASEHERHLEDLTRQKFAKFLGKK